MVHSARTWFSTIAQAAHLLRHRQLRLARHPHRPQRRRQLLPQQLRQALHRDQLQLLGLARHQDRALRRRVETQSGQQFLTANMKITYADIPAFTLILSGACALTFIIHSGHAGNRLGDNTPNKIAAGSSGRQWVWQNPLPQGNTLQDFSFIDTNNGFAVGARRFSKQQMAATTGSLLQAKLRTIFIAFPLLTQISEPL